MKRLILLALLALPGCGSVNSAQSAEEHPLTLKCEFIPHKNGDTRNVFYRCINDEVICYEKYRSMSCIAR